MSSKSPILTESRLENYTWRTRESQLNNTLPQFRTTIRSLSANSPIRIHFIHIRSSSPKAIPLLLLPSFPLTNLSLAPLLTRLANPTDPESQAYHIICPNIPGFGFSDAFNLPDVPPLATTAELFNTLMQRLGYEFYLASMSGLSSVSYHLAQILAQDYAEKCLGVNLISPPLQSPNFAAAPWQYFQFQLAKFFHASLFGYRKADFLALKSSKRSPSTGVTDSTPLLSSIATLGLSGASLLGSIGPNTLSYGLCDSPVGILSLILSTLRTVSAEKWTDTDVIDLAQLAWLPGPEAGLRFWSDAQREIGKLAKKKPRTVGVVGVTNFLGDNDFVPAPWLSWGNVKSVRTYEGKGGLVPWERVDKVVEALVGLSAEVLKKNERLMVQELEGVIVDTLVEEDDDAGLQLEVESPDTIVA
jgi:pimeloyl-ACP methyl ester carboxylesterase